MYVASTVEAASARAPVDVAVVAGGHGVLARLEQPDVLGQQLGGAPPLGVRVVPLHDQRTQSALRVGDGLGDDGDALVDRDDRGHPGLGERRLVIDRGDRGAEPRRVQHHRRQHPGEAQVDRETGGAENLRYGVDPQPPFAPDQPVVGRILRLHAIGDRKLLGPRRELGERRLPAARVAQNAVLDLDLIGGHVPRLGRRGHEARPRLSGGQPVPHPEPLHRVGRARELEGAAEVRVSVDVTVRPRPVRGVDDPDRIEVSVELLGDDRREPGVDPLPHLDLTRVRDDRPVRVDPDVRMDRVDQLLGREPAVFELGRSDERRGLGARGQRVGGGVNRGADPRIGPAAAEVPAHPRVDLRVVGGRVRLEQRHRGQRLPRLAVAALHDVAAVPRVADRVDHRTGGALDRRHPLSDRPLGRGLARLRVAPVDQHRARRAEAGPAPELRAVQAEDVPEHPQQRGLRVPVVDLDLGAVDDKLHLETSLDRNLRALLHGRRIAPTQVSCPHRMMVILPPSCPDAASGHRASARSSRLAACECRDVRLELTRHTLAVIAWFTRISVSPGSVGVRAVRARAPRSARRRRTTRSDLQARR